MEKSQIKPCPFCNSTSQEMQFLGEYGDARIECADCGAIGPTRLVCSETEAIESWNNASLYKEVERLKEEVTYSAKVAMEVTAKRCAEIAGNSYQTHDVTYDAAKDVEALINKEFGIEGRSE